MTEFKYGDRIKVEFEGTVSGYLGRGAMKVVTDGGGCFEFYHPENFTFTKVEPPIVLPEIPGTIVQVDPTNKYDERNVYHRVEQEDDDDVSVWVDVKYAHWLTTSELVDQCRDYGYRVIKAVTE